MSLEIFFDALENAKLSADNQSLIKQLLAYRNLPTSASFIRLVQSENAAIKVILASLQDGLLKQKSRYVFEVLSLYSKNFSENGYKEHVLQKYVVEGDFAGVAVGIELGVNPDTQIGYLPDLSHSKILQGLLQLLSFNAPTAWYSNWHHCTPLVLASVLGHYHIVQYLVEQGASLNTETRHHNTALDWASKRGHWRIENYLMSQGALRNTTSDAASLDGLASIDW
ncbi:MAG: Ankyrin repeat (3 copies) [Gammaproteobacteria bacterium]|jgi:hypothetical protein|nr:Ankyrin repeat (3 copies) [Gammaproteobacteria bacterium]